MFVKRPILVEAVFSHADPLWVAIVRTCESLVLLFLDRHRRVAEQEYRTNDTGQQ
jgi:hypothetical protein